LSPDGGGLCGDRAQSFADGAQLRCDGGQPRGVGAQLSGASDSCPPAGADCAVAGENCPELGEDCPKTGSDCPKVASTAERGAEDRPQSNAPRFLGKSASRTDVDSISAANSRLAPATATDPGSDDLTFTCEWGDGTPATARTYYNDGIGTDPYPSTAGTFPFTATDVETNAHAMAGVYDLRLMVREDDGGTTETIHLIDTFHPTSSFISGRDTVHMAGEPSTWQDAMKTR